MSARGASSGLRRKLGRDLWRLKGQALSIAVLVACGIASLLASVASYQSLQASRDRFYRQGRLADVFAHLERAPEAVLDRVRALPGVAAVEGGVSGEVRLELEDSTEPVMAHAVSLPAALDLPRVRAGQLPAPDAPGDVLLNQALADAWHLAPGARLSALIGGHRVRLRVAGVATSPQYLYILPRSGLADPAHYGLLWMDGAALARQLGLPGEVNEVALQLAAGGDEQEVLRRLDLLLEAHGGRGALGKGDQPSVRLVEKKVAQQRAMAVALPSIFLAVAAFILQVLLSRIVGTQREQIATLKALGLGNRELALHYLAFAGAITAAGIALGVCLGVPLGHALLAMYGRYFAFPDLAFHLDWPSLGVGALAALTAATLGALSAVRRAVAVPPAEAMRPEPPASFRPTALERLGAHRLLSPATRMVFRDLERRPGRLLLSAGSVALATAIMLVGMVGVDSIAEALRLQFEVSHREDVTATFDRPLPWRVVSDLQSLPGVRRAEGERLVPVRLRAGPRSKATSLLGVDRGSDLHRLLGVDQRPLQLPAGGLALSRALAEALEVRAGQEVEVEVLQGRRPVLRLPVSALVDDLFGLWGYLERSQLDAALGEAPAADVVLLAVDRDTLDGLLARLQGLPRLAGLSRPDLDLALMRAQVGDVYFALEVMLVLFASAISVAVVYNNARIALETRGRDLATLRILGFSRAELGVVLLGEQAVQVLLGLGPGLALGFWMGSAALASIDRELLRVPATVTTAGQVTAACVVVLAALVSGLVVRRQADRLDLVAVLKARD